MKRRFFLYALIISSLSAETKIISLDEAISIALENNRNLKISQASIDIANTMYNQAMSAHYPKLDVSVMANRLDEPATFELRGTTQVDNSGTKATYQALANAATADGDTVTAATYNGLIAATPDMSSLPINTDVEIMGRDTIISSFNMVLPLYTGGKISAITKQAKLGTHISQEAHRRTQNQVVYEVKKYYYGALLAKNLRQTAHDTLERMRFLSELTSRLYQGGSMQVKKTDYLRSKLSVSFVESLYETIKVKEVMAKSALANVIGLTFNDEVETATESFEAPVMNETMQALVSNAYKFNPDYNTLHLALKIKDAKIDEEKSAYLPSVALMGGVQHIYNDYEYGIINDTTKNSWNIGVGVKWSLFDGMLTTNKVEQAKLEKLQLEQQKFLLKDGLALQVKQSFLNMQSSFKQFNILNAAKDTASENRSLNTRAYQEGMVETKEVVEAQIFESLTIGNYYKAMHDFTMAKVTIDLIIGQSIQEIIH